jgi:hypothetical protein
MMPILFELIVLPKMVLNEEVRYMLSEFELMVLPEMLLLLLLEQNPIPK